MPVLATTTALTCQMEVMKVFNLPDCIAVIKKFGGICRVADQHPRPNMIFRFPDNSQLRFYPPTNTLAHMCVTIC